MRYQVDTNASKLVVKARSSIHDTTTVWEEISGVVDADPDRLVEEGATASFEIDMTKFDAGDWLKNRKLKKDFELERHPRARFELTELRGVEKTADGRFEATAIGTLSWRGRELTLTIAGSGIVEPERIEATGTFDLDIRDLGMKAPRILMFKVADEVAVEVTLRATPG